ncbi:Protein CBR-CWP-4 [Caenorhabditis briggsae]|uniref:Protein CBR-CWP-4 n=1 Tax=Caenorhabditis briggsae TaxID=6238 RepID=A8X6V6_CAEBR|nr:Protein CBR-CWP-4 [Caenorhabditis briggsae]CAP28367.2 Protein CBR-CWP-4 [Caenorhabditis briggsae]
MVVTQLFQKLAEIQGQKNEARNFKERFDRFRHTIHQIDELNMEAKVKMLFALSVPVDAYFLDDMKKDADVSVDEWSRITYYKRKDGELELKGNHPRHVFVERDSKIQGTLRASKIQGTLRASKIQGTLRASKIQGTLRASKIQGTLRASKIQGTLRASKLPADSLATLTQYEVGTEGDDYYSHFLVNGGASFTYGNVSAEAIRELSAYAISAATTNCTSSCLTSVSAFYKADSDKLTLIMLRPSDESLYPNYTSMGLPPFLCATVSGNCGSTKPLYQFYSSTYEDYYADVEQMNNTNATYSVAMMGDPLCYLWIPLTTTTTTTTTTTSPLNTTTTVPVNGTTTTIPLNETTNTSQTNETTTTLPINGTTTTLPSNGTTNGTTTTTPPSSGNVTTNTLPSTGTNTTTPSSGGNNSTNSPDGGGSGEPPGNSDGDNEENKGWWHTWRWPIIVAACLTGASIILSLIACLTCCFIGSAAVAAKPYSPPPIYTSPSPPELPPNPVEAPSVQPFTVGLPPSVPY